MVTLKELFALVKRILKDWIIDDSGVATGDLVAFDLTVKAIKTSGKKVSDFQAASVLLSALAALSATGGLVAKTGATTVGARTLSKTGSAISISNGDGAAGNPTVSLSALLEALSALSATGGIIVKTGAATVAARTLSKTGLAITVTNGDGASGNPTVALSALLEALSALSATGGLFAKTGAATVAARTLTRTGNGIIVTNGDGAAGNPTVALSALLEALSALSATGGIIAKTGAATVAARTLTKTGNGIIVTNGDGAAGNPTIALDIGSGATQVAAGDHHHDTRYTSLSKRTYIYADRVGSHASITSTGVYVACPLNGILYSNGDGGSYNTTTNIFQPNRAMIVQVQFSVASDNASATVMCYWYNQAGGILGGVESSPAVAPNIGSNYHPAVAGAFKMAATDYLRILIRVNSVTSQTVRYSNGTYFMVTEL